MYEIQYVKPLEIEQAVQAVADAEDGTFLAGGMTLIPTMKQRLASPDCVVDLSKCDLKGIKDTGDGLVIGAMSTHADVAGSHIVASEIPALAALASQIGDRQVRNRGTIGGSVANNDPSACYPSAVLGLGGVIHTNSRTIPADEFFTGMFDTALDEHELITAISLPKPDKAAYEKFANPASRYAMVGVFVAVFGTDIHVAITGAGDDGVFRSAELETALGIDFSPAGLEAVSLSSQGLMSDIHASADYRARLIVEMAKRAVARC